MSASAASAVSSSRAATAATGSPTKRTLSERRARARPGSRAGCRTGWAARGRRASPARRDAPRRARRRRCGCARGDAASAAGARTAMRGSTRSSAKTVWPVTLAAASTLSSGWPMTLSVLAVLLTAPASSRRRSVRRHGSARRLAAHARRRQLDRLEDLEVAGAAAEVAGRWPPRSPAAWAAGLLARAAPPR